jgi:hypothetical protein
VELHGFTGRQPDRAVGALPRQLLDRQPLRRSHDAGGNPHPHHEAERFLHALLAAFGPQVAVVLLVEAVEFGQLCVVIGQRAGFHLRQPFGDRAAQQTTLRLDAFVGRQRPFGVHLDNPQYTSRR